MGLGQREIFERFGAATPPYLIDGVIVLSAHSTCRYSPAAFLAGGDFDGDKANLNAYAPIVSSLRETAFDAKLIRELQTHFGKKIVPALNHCDDPLAAIERAHRLDSKCGALVGELGNRWAYECDRDGAASRHVLLLGLLFQEALDGKLDHKWTCADICAELGLARQAPLPPHWHENALKLLNDRADDAGELERLESLVKRARVHHSTSILGALFDSIDLCKVMAELCSRGHHHYQFEQVQKSGGVRPHPKLTQTRSSSHYFEFAQGVLERFFERRQSLNGRRHHLIEELFAEVKEELFRGDLNFAERKDRAVAFYNAQVRRFNIRVQEGKQVLTASKVEHHLEPAWRVCTQELCAYAASKDSKDESVCVVSHGVRQHLQYKTANEPLAWLRNLGA